jgi:hypothetical protein
LDWRERNICVLPSARVEAIVSKAIAYLRDALGDPRFIPVSFRSGLWALQPTAEIAIILQRHGIQVDSSVFKGARIHDLGLDYRQALGNDASWRFFEDVNVPNPDGKLLEIPIHTEMVPFWRMLGNKRLKLQKRVPQSGQGTPLPSRWRDFLRYQYPRKLDFCRMTFEEMLYTVAGVLDKRQGEPSPIVAIGHSKDFVDSDAVRRFLEFLRQHAIAVTTFSKMACIAELVS